MKIKILDKKEQPLMYRQELSLEVEFESEVPSRDFLKKQVAKATKADEKLVIIEKIESQFGVKKAMVVAHVYTDAKKLETFVRGYMKKRHEVETPKEEVKAEAPAEEKKEAEPEAPKEEAKEEVKEKPSEEKPAEEKKDE